ncbi:YceI family protein [Duganella sp. BJB488]|uniref:YceI family protein n=1 Tax=unclassified Duganella TaxID=2636909 RepID=UPI000E3575B5|nr:MULTISPECIES: YceI family protein [unclassified Duganella]RFP08790.1 YceI family protein [Duganella sp. BJB489]RFP18205.1 YceI family protein [Duganella sp. BJB488]RFP37967.1 YceI family protein [Duganella sp. BJB480]
MRKFYKYLKVGVLSGCVAACTQLPGPAQETPAAAHAPTPAMLAASITHPPRPATPAAAVLNIDSGLSLIAVTVRRGGLLARLGHDHVVASRHITGTVAPADNRADFQFRLDQLTVDEAELRIAAGLEKQPSADAIEGTRNNMLTRVLDAERYPLVQVHAERGAAGQPLQVAITLHGVTRSMAIPVEIRDAKGVMTVTGNVNLKQSDFGITPFSVMAGALAVQDQMELRFTLVAK